MKITSINIYSDGLSRTAGLKDGRKNYIVDGTRGKKETNLNLNILKNVNKNFINRCFRYFFFVNLIIII